jgi:hypothetical protein
VFGVSRASSISFDATVGSAHGLWDVVIDGASERLLFACSVGEVGVGRDKVIVLLIAGGTCVGTGISITRRGFPLSSNSCLKHSGVNPTPQRQTSLAT